MQWGSPSARLALAPGQLWGRARSSMGGGGLWSALIVCLLTYAIASSTATAAWVAGIEIIPLIALGGAVLMAVLAVSPVPWPARLRIGMILRPLITRVEARPSMPAQHPPGAVETRPIRGWWGRTGLG